MATTTSITTTYAGEFAGEYIAAALLSGETLSNGGVTIKPNIKFKEVIKKLSMNDILKDASCDFDPTSNVTLTERILQPEEFQVNLQLCKKDFRQDWDAQSMGFSQYDNLPGKFSDFLIAQVAAKVAQKVEQNIWQGATANAGEFNGFQALLAADGDVVDQAAVGGGLSAANIIAELGKVVDKIPSGVYGKEDLRIYLPTSAAKFYIQAQAALGYRELFHVGQTEMNFQGIPLFTAPGLGDDKMVAAQSSNLFFGTGLLNDWQEVKLIDMADIDGSQNVRIVLRGSAGVQHGIGSDIVLYA
jgi:hypothetical protein|tara:strand:- start:141 stop:1043 length:903 start_codon:yes stop_codon:yes gene_type:complete